MSTPPERPLKSTAPYAPAPSAGDAPSVPDQGGTVPQVGPSPAALAAGAAIRVPGYEIQGELGRGGMGVVYLAKNILMNRLEVLKVANRALLDRQPGAAERFLREIRAAANLSHENVVKAYSALQVGELLVFAMEYIEGEDLAKLVQRQGPLPVADGCHYISQTAMGLQHAHEQGMVHRDVKPHNLILSRRGKKHVVKILDFGLAKAVREGETATDLTGAGAMMGTPAYMAPEQAQDAATADIRADIYSLGCTLYFLLTGAPPFTGKSLFEILKAHESTEATSLTRLRAEAPTKLAAVAARMMAKYPAQRYQKPIDVAKALAPFIKAAPPAAKAGPTTAAAVGAGLPRPLDRPAALPVPPSLWNRPTNLPAWMDAPTGQAPRESKTETILPPSPQPAAPAPPTRVELARPRFSRGAVLALLVGVGVVVVLAATCAGGAYLLLFSGGPARAVAPFDAVKAKQFQQAWADSLGLPVEREVDLDGGVTMKLKLIPPGTFTMGSPQREDERFDDEGPQHPVEITKSFYLGAFPVTREQFAAFVKDEGYQTEAEKVGDKATWRNPFTQYNQTDNDPVVEVSWNDAVRFCLWLSKKEGRTYELPTEAEWEYACRAGTKTAYSFGDDPRALGDYAWFDGNSGNHTHLVGEKKPNPWGLYDMHGNVWQWCADRYDKYEERSVKDPKDPKGAEESRVLRGGSWHEVPKDGRSASRHDHDPGVRLNGIGFRVVLRPPPRTP